MFVLNQIENEKIFPYTLDNISQFTTTSFLKSKSEDMQKVSTQIAYLHHTDVNRGDYHS